MNFDKFRDKAPFSNDEVTVAKTSLKVSSSCLFKHSSSYFMSFNSSNNGEFLKLKSEGMYLASERKRVRKFSFFVFASSRKRGISYIHVAVVQRR